MGFLEPGQAVRYVRGMERGKQEHKELIFGVPSPICLNQSSFLITYFTYSVETKSLNTHIQKLNWMVSKVSPNSDFPRFPDTWLRSPTLPVQPDLSISTEQTRWSIRGTGRAQFCCSGRLEQWITDPTDGSLSSRQPDPESRSGGTLDWLQHRLLNLSLQVPKLSLFLNQHAFPYPTLRVPRGERLKRSRLIVLGNLTYSCPPSCALPETLSSREGVYLAKCHGLWKFDFIGQKQGFATLILIKEQ